MLDLNDLRIYERVATLRSFSGAARSLGLPKANVSRSIARLEETLGTRLLQRTTREVVLTATGVALKERAAEIMEKLKDTVDYVGGLTEAPRGHLKIATGVGFGICVLSETLPNFLQRYPDVDITLELANQPAELLADGIDVAIRLGPLSDSSMVAVRLGTMERYLCAAPAYLDRRGQPRSPDDISGHDTVERPALDGRPRQWHFSRQNNTVVVDPRPRISVNEVLTIYHLVLGGAGLGIIFDHLCVPSIEAGRIVRLLPDWTIPPVEIDVVFPSKKIISPGIRVFVDFLKEIGVRDKLWKKHSL
jgi:LysR family transcriptional regulator, regulator for bpeEF and oprC